MNCIPRIGTGIPNKIPLKRKCKFSVLECYRKKTDMFDGPSATWFAHLEKKAIILFDKISIHGVLTQCYFSIMFFLARMTRFYTNKIYITSLQLFPPLE